MTDSYDLIVVGGGAGGFVSAKFAHGLGKKVLLIEKHKLGGECTWYGCVPSKALLKSSHQYYLGFKSINPFEYTKEVVAKVYDTHTPDKLTAQGLDLELGSPKFLSKNSIEVNGKTYTFKKCVISTGSSPFIPPVKGISDVEYLANNTIFNLTKAPESIGIMGGGPIGIEMAFAFAWLGSKVYLFEMGKRIMPRDDEEAAEIIQSRLLSLGAEIYTNTQITEVKKDNDHVIIVAAGNNIKVEKLLVSAGRKTNTDGLGLENAVVDYDKKGIKVDEYLKTTNENIFACGDVIGAYQFSHTAEYTAKIAVNNAFIPLKKKVDYSNVPWCTFSRPEVAQTGMTEKEAREKFKDIKIYKEFLRNIDRGRTDGAGDDFVKVICDSKGYILGGTVVADRAGEMIHSVHYLKSLGIPFYKAYNVIHIYPTYMDSIKNCAKNAYLDHIMNNPVVKFINIFRKK